MLFAVVAIGKNGVIGNKDNEIPWKLPADMKHFKELTMGHPVIMGRKTYESIGKPLPGRQNIILTHQLNFTAPGGTVIVHSVDEAIALVGDQDAAVIGGAEIYKLMMSKMDRLYVTEIKQPFDGTAFFPEIDPARWKEVSRVQGPKDEKNPFEYYFLTYERIR